MHTSKRGRAALNTLIRWSRLQSKSVPKLDAFSLQPQHHNNFINNNNFLRYGIQITHSKRNQFVASRMHVAIKPENFCLIRPQLVDLSCLQTKEWTNATDRINLLTSSVCSLRRLRTCPPVRGREYWQDAVPDATNDLYPSSLAESQALQPLSHRRSLHFPHIGGNYTHDPTEPFYR